MISKTIAHLDLDTFFVSVERLVNPTLAAKPVIIGGVSDRGVVASCSYEARRFGVHAAMPMRMARQLCSQAVYIRGDMELYSRYSRLVTDVIADSAPLYEKASVDEHYLDLSGMDRFFGTYKWMHELRERIIRETGLPISFGLSQNKTVSKIATGQAKPNGELQVLPEQVHPFLDPLSIRKIPMVGDVGFRLLRSMGVAKIGTLRLMPPDMVQQVLGKNGLVVWKKANGIDPTPVKPYSERKSISSEHTFEQDTTDMVLLKQTLAHMVEKLAFELRNKQKLTACVTVKIRYANFDTHSRQKQISYTAFDHILLNTIMDLFAQLYSRRMLIRLVGVRFSHLVGGAQQLNMFEDTPELTGLYQAMDHIRRRYGKTAIGRAGGLAIAGAD
ncbi:MAG: DNA polymerase IV [Bacteroidetes bacterium]|nr:DNA polymerase IV [Bacteroidota bacterium]MBU1580381.1 DNA polymerase IV [Bacteroidota bacterium]MBU2466088.1 DNA polymerase IV [Bacteroidota bacterium]MBU2557921.1 DNA polymerase IV [Bacteroidota bacterium]